MWKKERYILFGSRFGFFGASQHRPHERERVGNSNEKKRQPRRRRRRRTTYNNNAPLCLLWLLLTTRKVVSKKTHTVRDRVCATGWTYEFPGSSSFGIFYAYNFLLFIFNILTIVVGGRRSAWCVCVVTRINNIKLSRSSRLFLRTPHAVHTLSVALTFSVRYLSMAHVRCIHHFIGYVLFSIRKHIVCHFSRRIADSDAFKVFLSKSSASCHLHASPETWLERIQLRIL